MNQPKPGLAPCVVPGCIDFTTRRKRGMCSAHYQRWYRSDPADRVKPVDVMLRISAKVVVDEAGCWVFTGFRKAGYGKIALSRGKIGYVHRVVYERLVGPIPDGLQLDHLCRNPPCCNPLHLEPVTGAENLRRAALTHCRRGHEFTPENTHIEKAGSGRAPIRRCIICRKAWRS